MLDIDYRNRKCTILGAGGFIGTNLCQFLVRAGASVTAFGRSPRFPWALPDVPWVSGTLHDSDALASALAGAELVFHLIGPASPALVNQNMALDVDANVVGTIRLLEACQQTSVQRVVFVSSGGTVYGIPNQTPVTEDAATMPISAYGITKLMVEKYLTLFERLHGLDYRVLRVSNPFGPFQISRRSQGVIAAFLDRVLSNQPVEIWGNGDIVRDYIYIDDVCTALMQAGIHQGSDKIFNIGSGFGRDLNNIILDIQSAIGRPVAVDRRPARNIDVPVNVLDISRAVKELSWSPSVTWEDGLSKSIEWMSTWRERESV